MDNYCSEEIPEHFEYFGKKVIVFQLTQDMLERNPEHLWTLMDKTCVVDFADCSISDLLHTAAIFGNRELLRRLLKYTGTSEINSLDDHGGTPLCTFLINWMNSPVGGDDIYEFVRDLLKIGAEVNVIRKMNLCDNNYTSLLGLAARHEEHHMVDLLIRSGAKADGFALLEAIHNKRYKTVKLLVKHGADVNFQPNENTSISDWVENPTPIQVAAFVGDKKIFQFLISRGVNIYAEAETRMKILYYAIESGNIEFLKFIIHEYGFDVTVKCNFMLSFASAAAGLRTYKWSLKMLLFILEAGASFDFDLDKDFLKRTSIGMPEEIYLIVAKFVILANSVQPLPNLFYEFKHRYHFGHFGELYIREISEMKTEIISSYKNISLYDFLIKESYSNYFLSLTGITRTITKNKKNYRAKYPIYFDIIQIKKKSFARQTMLIRKSFNILDNIIGRHFKIPSVCSSAILNYFSQADMKILNLE